MSNKNKLEAVLEQGVELLEFYRKNPVIAADDLLNVKLAPIQQVVFEDMWFKNYSISVCGRGFGKTFMLSLLATLSALLYPGYRVGLIGPVFRQSKMIFGEVEKLYDKSPILREACEKKPTRGADTCYLRFKARSGTNGSFVEAIPLGDGNKIRGSRYYLICVDELAQVPDKVLDMVLRPMAATAQDPMENVLHLERKKKLIEAGLATDEDFEERANKMIMASSGYYKFNHMWRRMKDYWKRMYEDGENSQYVVHQVPYWFLPEGFQDKNNIEEAKRIMSRHEYSMEYEAAMISDSEGFFKASLLEECTSNSNVNIEMTGDKSAKYIMGVDPNQGGSASCGIVIIKMGDVNGVVRVIEAKGKTTQDLVKQIQYLCEKYNIIRVYMDKGGGGKALLDLLEEGYDDKQPILDRSDDDNRFKAGRHILEMVNFSTSWIADANFSTLSLLEDQKLKFPEAPTLASVDIEYKIYESIRTLKSQMLNIVVTQTASGALHFDTPKKGQNKDLYSAIILACYGIRSIDKEHEVSTEPQIYSSGGFVRSVDEGSYWNDISNLKSAQYKAKNNMSAVLKRRIK